MRPADLILEGGITEIFGRASSGRTSLLVACVAEVTRRGALAALVDTDHVFDPVGAARGGVELSRLLWVRCGGSRDRALRAVDLLVRCPGFTLVALDAGARAEHLPLAAAYRLKLAVWKTRTALIVVAGHRLMASGSALALQASRRGFEWRGPRPSPTRLEGAGSALEVVRAQSVAVDLRPGTVHLAWWKA